MKFFIATALAYSSLSFAASQNCTAQLTPRPVRKLLQTLIKLPLGQTRTYRLRTEDLSDLSVLENLKAVQAVPVLDDRNRDFEISGRAADILRSLLDLTDPEVNGPFSKESLVWMQETKPEAKKANLKRIAQIPLKTLSLHESVAQALEQKDLLFVGQIRAPVQKNWLGNFN